MKHWIAVLVAALTLTGCMRDPNNLNPSRSYMPVKEVFPPIDQCIAKNGQMVRCDQAK